MVRRKKTITLCCLLSSIFLTSNVYCGVDSIEFLNQFYEKRFHLYLFQPAVFGKHDYYIILFVRHLVYKTKTKYFYNTQYIILWKCFCFSLSVFVEPPRRENNFLLSVFLLNHPVDKTNILYYLFFVEPPRRQNESCVVDFCLSIFIYYLNFVCFECLVSGTVVLTSPYYWDSML